MASEKSYKITLKNNRTEKEAVDYLLSVQHKFLLPTLEGRKTILQVLEIENRYRRAFDLFAVDSYTNDASEIEIIRSSEITLIEVKSTRKKLEEIPFGFFFGATENEFDLAKKLGQQYKFCFISLHPDSLGYALLSLEELEPLIRNKRTQFQINLKRSGDN